MLEKNLAVLKAADIHFRLPEETAKRLKISAIEDGTSIQKILEKLVRDYLDKKEK